VNGRASELKGDSHYDAYKFRQLAEVMNRLFFGRFPIANESLGQLRRDQIPLFPLKGLYRYRLGRLRIIYQVVESELKVLVIEIGPRGSIYK